MNILVTGGAGYVGSFTVRKLGEAGHHVITYDNLSTGHRSSVLNGVFINGDLSDFQCISDVLINYEIDMVMHFAASSEVAESIRDPLKYYVNNTSNTVNLLAACEQAGVDRIVFSSTAAVYGQTEVAPLPEAADLMPVNPYGSSKVAIERILADLSARDRLHYVSLRYFNAAGASPDARIGECHTPETHLIPLLLQVASGRREKFTVYGTDYDTPDGTCIRDFVHVEDIATAHVQASEYLQNNERSAVLNCGYGFGFSVREVINMAKEMTKVEIPIQYAARRPGDPPILIADNRKIRDVLSWTPEFDDLWTIITHAWAWEKQNNSVL